MLWLARSKFISMYVRALSCIESEWNRIRRNGGRSRGHTRRRVAQETSDTEIYNLKLKLPIDPLRGAPMLFSMDTTSLKADKEDWGWGKG